MERYLIFGFERDRRTVPDIEQYDDVASARRALAFWRSLRPDLTWRIFRERADFGLEPLEDAVTS